MKKRNLTILAAFTLSVIAVFALLLESGADANAEAMSKSPPTRVGVLKIKPQTIHLTESLPGRTNAYRIAQIRPQVTGIVKARLFEEGKDVIAGQQLYQLNDEMFLAARDSAAANLERANANADSVKRRSKRYDELIGEKAISQQVYDDIETELAQANAAVSVAVAQLKTAELNLSYTKITSPISGRIGRSLISEGDLVTANQSAAIATVTQLDPIYVDITQSSQSNLILRQKAGSQQSIKVRLDTGNGLDNIPEGKLQFSDVLVDASTGSVHLRAIFPNPDLRLLPGLFVNAHLDFGEAEAILTPQKTVTRDSEGNASIWLVKPDNTVVHQPIETDGTVGNQWIVKSGLVADDIIVLDNSQRIRNGASVLPEFIGDQ